MDGGFTLSSSSLAKAVTGKPKSVPQNKYMWAALLKCGGHLRDMWPNWGASCEEEGLLTHRSHYRPVTQPARSSISRSMSRCQSSGITAHVTVLLLGK